MGELIYGHGDAFVAVDDRTLAHLQVVIVDKLRRNESFALTLGDAARVRVMFVTPHTPLAFVYAGNRHPRMNPDWLQVLALAAASTEGLTVVAEPAESAEPSG